MRPSVFASLRDGRTVTLTLSDRKRDGRRLPDGVSGAIVFRVVGENPPATHDGWQFVALTGRPSLDIYFDESTPPAAQVWFTAA